MALDDRLKDSMQRSSLIVDPDVRHDLSEIRRKTRRAVIRQRIGNTLLVAALVATTVYLGPRVLEIIQSQRRVPADQILPAELVGTYRVDLSGGEAALVDAGLAGPWTISFNTDGSIVWNPPSGASIGEGFPRDTYQVAGSSIVMNLFVRSLCRGSGVGTYSWTLSGGALEFFVVSDPCDPRRAVLTFASWNRT